MRGNNFDTMLRETCRHNSCVLRDPPLNNLNDLSVAIFADRRTKFKWVKLKIAAQNWGKKLNVINTVG